ncbi:MAG: hypothetical protein JW701_00720, partial [Kosmotogaceae bacterium]|nr:hypothetical protein [Kosmotogaceae bacterium]
FGDGGFKWEAYSLENKIFTIDWGLHPDGISEKFRRMVNVVEPYKAFLVYNDGAECTFDMCEGDDCYPITTTTLPTSTDSMRILRYAGSKVVEDYTPGINYRDGETIGQYLDIYGSGGTWVNDAIDGISKTNAKIICYFNYAAMTPNGAGYVDDLTGEQFYDRVEYVENDETKVRYDYGGRHDDWVLNDNEGDIVYENSWKSNIIMDCRKDPWRYYTRLWTEKRIGEGYDGMFIDNGFTSRINLWHMSGVPLKPENGQEFTTEEWVKSKVEHVNYLKSEFPDSLFISNGLWDGELYYREGDYDWWIYTLKNMDIEGVFAEGVFSNIEGVMVEDAKWVKSIEMIKEVQDIWLSRGEEKIAVWHSQVNNSVSGKDSTNKAYNLGLTLDQVAKYYFCSLLMGVSDPDSNYLSTNNYAINDPDFIALLNIDLGRPIGDYGEVGVSGVYKREYANVIVYVNPSRHTRSADGMTFKPFSGEILVK